MPPPEDDDEALADKELMEEEWVHERASAAITSAREITDLSKRVGGFPNSPEESAALLKQGTLSSIRAVALDIQSKKLSPPQVQAAVMLGSGLLFPEVAEELSVPEVDIHLWAQEEPEFRRLLRYWRAVTEEAQFGKALREIENLAEVTESPKIILALIRLRLQLARSPEEREKWLMEHDLRRRIVDAREKDVEVNRPPPFEVPTVSVEEVITVDGSDEELEDVAPWESDEEDDYEDGASK